MSVQHRLNLNEWLRHQKNSKWIRPRIRKLRVCLWEIDGYSPPIKRKKK